MAEVKGFDGNSSSAITTDANTPNGYRRPDDLQQRFDSAAQTLLQHDGWANPEKGGRRELVADLALEGGGVKGIGLVGAVLVLSEAGYRFRGVAGTSAGAIAASLIAAISKSDREMTELKSCMDSMHFDNFMPEGKLHSFLDHHGGKPGGLAADAAILTRRMGIYPGNYLEEWLTPHLLDFGVTNFGDLKLTEAEDPGHEPGRRPRLPARRPYVRHHPFRAGASSLGLSDLRPWSR